MTDLKRQIEGLQAELVSTAKAALDAELALQQIRGLLDLALPSQQTGPEWEQCVRVSILRLSRIDDILRGVLGDPIVTDEPKPALH